MVLSDHRADLVLQYIFASTAEKNIHTVLTPQNKQAPFNIW